MLLSLVTNSPMFDLFCANSALYIAAQQNNKSRDSVTYIYAKMLSYVVYLTFDGAAANV